MGKSWKKRIVQIGGLLFWLTLWHVAASVIHLELLLPSPKATFFALGRLILDISFWQNIACSFLRILSGFTLAVIVGSGLALITRFVPYANEVCYPLLSVMKATPVASFIILLILWTKSTLVPVIAVFLMVMPVIWSNMMTGLGSSDKKLLEMAQVFRFGKIKTFFLIYLPACRAYFLTACVMSIGFAWKAGIAAEVLSTPKFSIGTRLYASKVYLETAELFAWTLVVIILSIGFEKLFKQGVQRLSKGGENDTD